MTTELLPCPFCGEDPITTGKENVLGDIMVYCWGNESCGHRGLMMTEKQWNTRLQKATLHGVEFKIKRDCTANVQQDEELEAYKQKLHDMEKKWVAWIWGE